MQLERALLGGAVAVVVVALLAALVVPGAIATPGESVRNPGPVGVAELSVRTGQVSGSTAELTLTAQVSHRGNPAENVTVRFRAIDTDSSFVADEQVVEVGRLTDDGWTGAEGTLEVPREGSYVLEATVFRDGKPTETVRKQVQGMGALQPAYASAPVEFTEEGTTPTVAVSVVDAGADRTTLRISTSVTNGGDGPASGLKVVVYLRQPDSNIIADRAETTVGTVRAGRTTRAATEVTIPNGYNYYIDVALYRDGVLVDTTRSVANLAPDADPLEVEGSETDAEFNVTDFEPGDARPSPSPAPAATEVQTPGFGPAPALVALLAALLVARLRRWNDE